MIKHELNDYFDWQERQGPYRLLTTQQAEQYNRDGFVVFEDVFDHATIDALLTDLDPLEQQSTDYLRKNLGGKAFIARADEITFSPHAVTRSAGAKAFTHNSFFQDLTYDLLGPDVRLYWDQLVYKKPGNPEVFPWHQDNGYTFIQPQQYLTCWIALSDADENNGCPWVIPGAHRVGTYQHHMTELGWKCTTEEPKQRISAPARKGSVVAFSSLTPHMTGPNLTDQVRKTYIIQFAPDGANAISFTDGKKTAVPCRAAERQFSILVDGQGV